MAGCELVLDPFAGSGALGAACAEAGARAVWLNDISGAPAGGRAVTPGLRWTKGDFRDLHVTPGSVSAVVTDPPWGNYAPVEEGVGALYRDLGVAAWRWLKPAGALVVLTAAGQPAADLGAGGLQSESQFPVLVNGRKAKIVVARRPSHRRASQPRAADQPDGAASGTP